jgi:hypothetical protein
VWVILRTGLSAGPTEANRSQEDHAHGASVQLPREVLERPIAIRPGKAEPRTESCAAIVIAETP